MKTGINFVGALAMLQCFRLTSYRGRCCAAAAYTLLLCAAASLPAGAQSVRFAGIQTTVPTTFYGVVMNPTAIAMNGAGDLYVADYNFQLSRYEDPSGWVVRFPADGSTPVEAFTSAILHFDANMAVIAVDNSGNLFVAERDPYHTNDSGKVLKFSPTSIYQGWIGYPNTNNPFSVAVDSTGNNVFVQNWIKDVIKVDSAGNHFVAEWFFAHGMAVDQAGNVYLANNDDTIRRLGAGCYGGCVSTVATGLNNPIGITVNRAGDIFVADQGNNRVLKIPAGCTTAACQTTVGYGLLGPQGVAFNENTGELFIADTGHTRVVKVQDSSADFGRVNIGASSQLTLTFNVVSNVTLGNVHVLTQGAPNLDYTASSSTCTGNQSAGGTCTVTVSFAPRAPGLRMGAVELADSSGNTLVSLPIKGEGFGPAIVFEQGTQYTVSSDLRGPYDVAVNGAGDVFIADSYNHRVVKVPADGSGQTTVADGLTTPLKLAVDGAGAVFVAEASTNSVVKVPAGCTAIACRTTVASGVDVAGVATDGAGRVLISDFSNQRILRVPAGCNSSACQQTVGAPVDRPEGLTIDATGNVYVAQPHSNQITRIPVGCQSAACQVAFGSGLSFSADVAVDAAGDVFIPNAFSNQVVKIPHGCTDASCQTTLGTGFAGPFGIDVDAAGNVLVASPANDRVIVVQRSQLSTVSFPATAVGATSAPLSVKLQNIGNAALALSSVVPSANFALDSATTSCQTQLDPGASCNIGIVCSPTTGGTLSGTLTITDNALNTANATQLVPLSCSVSGLPTPQTRFTGAPATAAYLSTFTVTATTNAGSIPAISAVGACSVSAVAGTASSATAQVTMTSGAGTCSLTANWAADSSYAAATASQTTTAGLSTPTVAFSGAPVTARYQTTFTVAATTNASTTPTITAEGPCTVAGNLVTMTSGTGSCSLLANWPADGNFIAGIATQTTIAAKAVSAVTFTGAPASAVYQTTFPVSATSNSSAAAVIDASGACSIAAGVVTITSGTGTCSLTANWPADDNYAANSASQTTSAAKAAQTITITTVAPASAAYNASFPVAATSNSGLPVTLSIAPASVSVCSLSGSSVTMLSGTGTCTIAANQPGDANYSAAAERQTSAAASKIDQAPLSLTAASPMTYGDTEIVSASGGTLAGPATITASGSCSLTGNQLRATSGTGSCVVVASLTGNNNYRDVTASSTITLTKAAQSITFSQPASPAAYGTSYNVSASSTSALPVSITTAGGCSATGTTVTMTSGSIACSLTASQAGDANYAAASNVVRTVSATPAVLSITANPSSKLYMAAVPGFSVQYSGFKGADNPSVLSGSLSCNTTAAQTSPVGRYAITCSGLTSANYTIGWTGSQLTIVQLPLAATVSLSSASPQYSDSITINVSIPNAGGVPPAAGLNFKIGSVDLGTAALSLNGAYFTGSVSSVVLTQAPGAYAITTSFVNPDVNYVLSSGPTPLSLTVAPEDARSTYTGPAYINTPSATSYSATVPLSFTIQDITALGPYVAGTATSPAGGDQAYDPSAGNIKNATVKVIDALTNTTICASATLGFVQAGDTTTATATCSFTANLPTSGASAGFQTYSPQVVIGGYYVDAEAVSEQALLTVAVPLTTNFISAGGSIIETASAGSLPGALGSKTHFGLNVKYNKSGTNLQGNAFLTVRSKVVPAGDTCPADANGYHVYRFKTNSITSLTTQTSGGVSTASLLGGASILDITSNGTSICSYSVDGGATLQITMTDKGSSGDTVGMSVWQAANKGGDLWFSSNWSGGKNTEVVLATGTVSVR